MMKLRKIIQASAAAFVLAFALAVPALIPELSGDSSLVHASAKDQVRDGLNAVGGGGASGGDVPTFIRNVINILLFVVGAIAVVMIVIGGFRYVISSGDSNAVNGAKNTILYAVVGLVVAIMAYAIVNFVLTNILK